MSRCCAVVLGYWPNRVGNVETIVKDLLAGDRVPEKIIVMLQGEANPFSSWSYPDDRVDVVSTESNFHTRAKFVTALLDFADYYLLMDDDTSVGKGTLSCLEYWAVRLGNPEFVTGYWGVSLNGDKFMTGNIWQPNHLHVPVYEVDAFHGRAIFATRGALVRMLDAEGKVRKDAAGNIDWPHEGDDLIIGLANRESSWCVPMLGDDWFVDLDQCGQALQFGTDAEPGDEHYFDMRDRFCADAVRRLRG